jgi:LemA protein
MTVWILLAVLALVALYFIFTYNALVNLKHNVTRAWANIDVLLKQRHDEIPKLVDACKRYMSHEQGTLEGVMRARSQVQSARESHDVAALGAAEDALHAGLMNLFAVAEAYPDLKADESFKHLMGRVSGVENAIADRREFYNESVNVHNVRIEQFPDLIVARLIGFLPFTLLKFSAREKADVDVGRLFAG